MPFAIAPKNHSFLFHRLLRFLLVIVALLTEAQLGCGSALAAPVLTGFSGTANNGSTIVLRGSAFGQHGLQINSGIGPAGWIEQNAAGTSFNNLQNAPGWDVSLASVPPTISSERVYSGSRSVLARVDFAANQSWQSGLRYRHTPTFNKIYATFWIYWDPINLSPHRSTQWKFMRINHNGIVSDQAGQIYFSSRHNTAGEVYDYQWITHCALDCPGVSYDHCMQQAVAVPYYPPRFGFPYEYRYLFKGNAVPWTMAHPSRREWNRIELYIDRGAIDTFTGQVQYTMRKPGQGKVFEDLITQVKTWRSDAECRNPQDPWQYFQIQNYWDDDGSNGAPVFASERADFFYDDIYLQFGTQARVEMGDSPNYHQSQKLEIQRPTAWSDGSISLQLNFGRFASGENVYLYVVDENGAASPGFALTLGTGGTVDTTAPQSPQNLQRVN